MEDDIYVGGFSVATSPLVSENAPFASMVPGWISCMAYPTQFRTSSDPCRSQVLDDSVISTRTNCVVTGASESLSVTVPPEALVIAPDGNTFHSPSGPRSKSSASFPTQYSTW